MENKNRSTHYIRNFIFCWVFIFHLIPIASATVRLSQIETYLNNLKTFQASFKQWDQNGALTMGTLYLKRPGHIRMNYKAPSKLVILSDGKTLFFIDRATADFSYMPVGQSPAAFLLEAQVDFQKDFNVNRFVLEDNLVKLTISRKDSENLGSLTLVFQKAPQLQLVQWIILDGQNKKTIVNLSNIKVPHTLEASLFDPSPFLKKQP